MTEIIRRFDGAERTDILFSTGNSLASVADVSRGGIDLPWIVGGFPEEFHRDLARGAGGYLRARMPLSGDLDGRIRGQLDEVLAGPYGEAVAEGLGMSLEFPLRRNLPNIRRRSERALTVVPEAWREAVRRGMALADPPPVPE